MREGKRKERKKRRQIDIQMGQDTKKGGKYPMPTRSKQTIS